MAEQVGFEPTRHLTAPSQFSRLTPSTTWVLLQNMGRTAGIEPTTTVPQTVVITFHYILH